LLVVILILSTLMAIALPLYLSAMTDAAKKTCRANMHDITSAATAWRSRTQAVDFTALTLSSLSVDMGSVPICPNGGTYAIQVTGTIQDENGNAVAIPTGALGVTCSYPGHYGFIPGAMAE